MHKIIILLVLSTLLTACSYENTIKDKIDIGPNIEKCIVFADHIECKFSNGNTYYMMKKDYDAKTVWDKSAWKVPE